MQLHDYENEFSRRNAKIVVVTFEEASLARRYVEETRLPWPLLLDENRGMYRNYGMFSASFWDVWGPKTWWVYIEQLMKGQRLKKSAGDIFQRGGDVLIDPAGMVRFHHVGRGPADRPAAGTILGKISADTEASTQ